MKKLTPIAALAAAAALALPVASWADAGTPARDPAARLARIQERIQKVEARIDAATKHIAALRQKLDERCSGEAAQPASAAGGDQPATAAPSRAERCAKARARLQQAEDRLQKAKDRLADVKARLQKWLENHNGQNAGDSNGGSGLSAGDQAALAQLQQQLAAVNG
jgi:DNA repair exonuclease SbcCD ATPase subunit